MPYLNDYFRECNFLPVADDKMKWKFNGFIMAQADLLNKWTLYVNEDNWIWIIIIIVSTNFTKREFEHSSLGYKSGMKKKLCSRSRWFA